MYLGIDLGTQGVKALLIDAHGEVVRVAQESYPIHSPQPGWAEQYPQDWWDATQKAVQVVTRHYADQVQGIGLAGQMHGMVLLDAAGQVLRPAIIWMDTRSRTQVAQMKAAYPDWFATTQNPVTTGMAGVSLLWMQVAEPELLEAAAMFLLPKDWLRYRLTGGFATDVSDASGSLLMDIPRVCWSAELTELVDMTPRRLPHLMKSVALVGNLTPSAALELGLPEDIPVGVGAADQAAMLVGAGVLHPGEGGLTIGTGGQLSVVTETAHGDPRLNLFCHAAKDRWYSMGAILAAGYALTWWSKMVGKPLDVLLVEAESILPGAEGVRFYPYLNGERTPHMDSSLTASFVGLRGFHTRAHITRAVLEGVAFAMRDCLGVLHAVHAEPHNLVFSGGGSQNGLWRRIFASVLNTPLQTLQITHHQTAYGAAMLLAVGLGHYASLEEVTQAWLPAYQVILPDEECVGRYLHIYEDWSVV